jgi:hypothetical protein
VDEVHAERERAGAGSAGSVQQLPGTIQPGLPPTSTWRILSGPILERRGRFSPAADVADSHPPLLCVCFRLFLPLSPQSLEHDDTICAHDDKYCGVC